MFIAPFTLFAITKDIVFYYAEVLEAAVYGVSYAVWAAFAIPRYHAQLKQRFSYTENINLSWLRAIFFSFLFILVIWIIDCMEANYAIEALYMTSTLVMWMFIAYYTYKHESVLGELSDSTSDDVLENTEVAESEMSEVGKQISTLFDKEQIFLNPNLKVSDIATATGTNRTYVSAFFNREAECTFYDYVNKYRIEYACNMLLHSNENITMIAEKSGFNSSQSFIRVFSKIMGTSPTKYRNEATS